MSSGQGRITSETKPYSMYLFPVSFTYSAQFHNDEYTSYQWGINFQNGFSISDRTIIAIQVSNIRIGFGSTPNPPVDWPACHTFTFGAYRGDVNDITNSFYSN